jgi:hypothetical protein
MNAFIGLMSMLATHSGPAVLRGHFTSQVSSAYQQRPH